MYTYLQSSIFQIKFDLYLPLDVALAASSSSGSPFVLRYNPPLVSAKATLNKIPRTMYLRPPAWPPNLNEKKQSCQ